MLPIQYRTHGTCIDQSMKCVHIEFSFFNGKSYNIDYDHDLYYQDTNYQSGVDDALDELGEDY